MSGNVACIIYDMSTHQS